MGFFLRTSFLFFIRLTVCDIHGISRGKLVPSRSAEAVLEKGMGSYIGKFMGRLILKYKFNRTGARRLVLSTKAMYECEVNNREESNVDVVITQLHIGQL